MSINEKYFDIAMEKLRQRRDANRAILQSRHREICEKQPRYALLEQSLAETSAQLIRLMLTDRDNSQTTLKQLEESNLAMQNEMHSILTGAGYPADYLEEIFTCPVCRDKGTADGKWCECVNKLMLNAAAEELNSVSPMKLSTFESFDLGYFSAEIDPALGVSHRDIMKKNYEFCKRYAEEFTTDSEGIFMSGGTGLGKTHLSLAIADTVIRKGYSVIYGSVPELLRDIEKQHYGKSEEDTLGALTRCDLLILDDLGAEAEKATYPSLLYQLINARISRGLPMIINSNCGANELKSRYQDRIWSRIFSYEVLMFVGQDVRRRLRK